MIDRRVSSGSPFEARAGYSRAVVSGEWIFVAGTTGYDYASMTMPDSAKEQARNAMRTIEAALREVGSSLADVVRANYFVTHRDHAEGLFDIVGAAFADIRPASTLLVCDLLRSEMKIEIEVTARRSPT